MRMHLSLEIIHNFNGHLDQENHVLSLAERGSCTICPENDMTGK